MKTTKDDIIEIDGLVLKAHPSRTFLIKLDNNKEILCYVSGVINKNRIKIVVGDRVKVELSTYDLTKGRITYRY